MSLDRRYNQSKHAERRRITRARNKDQMRRIRVRMLREGRTTCHLCDRPIRLDVDQYDPEAFTLDHLDPVSMSDARWTKYEDVAPAHRRCNTARGTKSVEATRLELRGLAGVELPPPGEYVKLPDGGFLNSEGFVNSRPW